MQKHFKEGLKIGIVPLDGAVEALKTLSKDYNIYISTNGDSFVAKEKIKEEFLDHYSNYEEEYEADSKVLKKKEKRKGKRFKE